MNRVFHGSLSLFLLVAGCSSTSEPSRYDIAQVFVSDKVDILFVIDDSGAMVAEQRQIGEAFPAFTERLAAHGSDFRVGVISDTLSSPACPPCDGLIQASCTDDIGDNGELSDMLGSNQGTDDMPIYQFESDPNCSRLITEETQSCFYDPVTEKGIALTGVNGCGYDRGLAAARLALGELAPAANAGFLREEAALAVVLVTIDTDCGEVGDISESLPGVGADVCFFAAKGEDPEGKLKDPDGRRYYITPVTEYVDSMMGLKRNRVGMVKFAGIVGVKDVNDLSTTTIEYIQDGSRWEIGSACTTSECTGDFCAAKPGTRYIELAGILGIGADGFIDTICQADFTDTMRRLGDFIAGCPRGFVLGREIRDPTTANLLINGRPVPRYSCTEGETLQVCQYTGDESCPAGECVATWTYHLPTMQTPHGMVTLAAHYDACALAPDGILNVEVVHGLDEDS